jgi:uncharacterized protein (TIGR02145 family)
MNHGLFFLLFLMSLMMQRVMAQTTTSWNGSAWSDGNPDANKDVVISSGTFTTSINSNFHCKNLTIHSGATLEVLAGDTFSVSGVVTNDGTLTNNGYLILRSCGKYSVTDVDGNSYVTVQIGTQCWTQSNLRVSKYRNGDNITNITDNTQWSQTNTSSTGAWSHYNNDANNGTTYGKLYNWYAVNDSRGLCPTGWHVPTDDEWTILTDHLGDTTMAGGKMKNTTGWNAPNTSASNASAFTALPGGFRGNGGNFSRVGNYGYWWSTSDTNTGTAWLRGLDYSDAIAERIHLDHKAGFSVRCLRDVAAVALPSVSTSSVTNITSVSAIAGGMVTAAGGGTVLARGVAYATSINPTLLGSFTYNGQGTGSYSSTLSGLSASTTYYVRAYASNSVGTAYGAEVSFTTEAPSYVAGSVHCSGSGATVVEVTNPTTGRTWMDRNLGASRVATSMTDTGAYGDLYQWGRRTDAHQCRNSSTTSTVSSVDQPAHGNFITTSSTDWRSPLNDLLWQGVGGTNNPCPTGFRLPTAAEFQDEINSWSTPDAQGGFAAPLKWTLGGHRNHSNAQLVDVGSIGFYWSSSIGGSNAQNLYIDNGTAVLSANFRATALSVRCIKN